MSMTMGGRKMLRMMINKAKVGTSLVTFRLFGSVAYDSSTGLASDAHTDTVLMCFLMRGDDTMARQSGDVTKCYIIVLEDGALTRVPSTEDEVYIDGVRYTIIDTKTDPMKVQLKITVCEA